MRKINWNFITILTGAALTLYVIWWDIGEFLTQTEFTYGNEVAAVLCGIFGTSFVISCIMEITKEEK